MSSRPGSELPAGLPTGEAKVRAVRSMFDAIAPRYDLVNRVMTFGMDRGWRRRCVRSLELAPASLVLDVACGTGDLCRELARAGHIPVGVDLSRGMLQAARTQAPLVQGDVLHLGIPSARVDGAVCGFALRNVVDLRTFLVELARIVRPGGRIALLDVAQPRLRLLRWGHDVYFGRVVPRIGALLSDAAAYRYLPESAAYLPPPDELTALVGDAGFTDVRRQLLSGGIVALLTGARA